MWACDPALTSTIVNSYQAAGPLFVQALQSFLAAQCAIAGDDLWPADATQQVLQDPNYDFVVVGSGSAGAVIANRLSEIPQWKVLLVEAGGDPTLATEMPQVFYNNLMTSEDWGYKTQPQKSCLGSKDKRCYWPRGKVLGGSSSINAMFYVRGNKADYDEWASDGNYGWSYEDVLPYFKKSENFESSTDDYNKFYHSKGGYLNIERPDEESEIEALIAKAVVETGMKYLNDINAETQMGVTRSFTNTKFHKRHGTARAFLSPIKDRKNLHVVKNALATKILFMDKTVSGLVINKEREDIIVNIRKELIISAGTINSPQLLMLSGIGPQKHLKQLNIEVIADLPVGENLQDHVFVPTYYKIPSNYIKLSLPNIIDMLLEYIMDSKGILGKLDPHRTISFMNTSDSKSTTPDMQFHYLPFPPSSFNLVDMYAKHDFSDEVQRKYREINADDITLQICNVLLKPKSRGKILLKSKDPTDHPLIYANYFDHPDDMAIVIRAIKQHSLRLADTETFKKSNITLQWLDLEACKGFHKESDDFYKCMTTEMTITLYHPTSTVKMGPDSDISSVVDPELRVRKVTGLRVIDGSIMPSIVRGNTNAPIIMIGEKGADIIKKAWLDNHTEL